MPWLHQEIIQLALAIALMLGYLVGAGRNVLRIWKVGAMSREKCWED
jgi:hypothetical protein